MRLCLFIALSITGIFAQQDSLTLGSAVEIVLKRHPSIEQAKQALLAAQEHSRGLRSSYFPNATAEASYINIGPDDPLSIPKLGTFKFFPENGLDAHVGVSYTVYDFGKRAASIETGLMGENVSSDALRLVQTALSYRVVRIFNALLLLTKSLQVADEEITELQRHFDIVKKRLESGSATEYDLVKTETQRAAAQGRRIDIRNELAKNQTSLRGLLGLPGPGTLTAVGSFLTQAVPSNADSLVNSALKNRIEMIGALHKKEAALVGYQNAEKENAPSIGIAATAGVKNGLMPDIDKLQLNWTAGARLSVPLYDGKRSGSHALEAQRNVAAAEAAVADTRERITTEVFQAKADVEAACVHLSVSDTQVVFARKTLELARLKYEAGVITANDVLDAEIDYTRAQLDGVQTYYRFTESLNALDQACGVMPRLK